MPLQSQTAIRTESIGRAACVSTLARMMLRLHQQQIARQRLQVVSRPVQTAEAGAHAT